MMHIEVEIAGSGAKKDRMYLGDTVAHAQQLLEVLRAFGSTGKDDSVNYEVLRMTKASPLRYEIAPVNPSAKQPRSLESVVKRIDLAMRFAVGEIRDTDLREQQIVQLSALATMARKLARENRSMSLTIGESEYVIGRDVADKLDSVLNYTTYEVGTMRGTLEVIRNREKSSFNLYPVVGPKEVRCEWKDQSLMPVIIEAFQKRGLVEVEGRMHQRRRSRFPHLIEVVRVDLLDDDPEELSILELRDKFPAGAEPEGGWYVAW